MNKPSSHTSNSKEEPVIDSADIDKLVNRAVDGDEEAFGEIVQLYYTRMFHVVYRITRHEEDARDVLQQAWVKAWKKLKSYRRQASFYTWIYRIAVNTALDAVRKRTRRSETPFEEAVQQAEDASVHSREESPERDMYRADVMKRFRSALEKLKPEHRTALVLREVEGMSYREIAEVMKVKAGTVMSRIFYARKAVQKELKDLV